MSRLQYSSPPRKQHGAVAIMLGLAIFVLIGFTGLALDLGHLYIARTELQNAADAAALAGAKDLDQTAAGVTTAVGRAIAIAAQHDYNFSTPVDITIANIWVGSSPDDTDMVPASSVTDDAAAAGKTFLKVDTGARTLSTWFMRVPIAGAGSGIDTMSTSGLAVAGRFVVNVAPIGICAVDPSVTSKYTYPDGTTELVELGFRRGVSYNLFGLGPLGGPSDPWLINPVDTNPGTCDPFHSSANFTAPFICSGDSAVVTSIPGHVWGNTGTTASGLSKELNSRFDDYGGSKCVPGSAPPDANIREYPNTGAPPNWMEPDPTQQTVEPLYSLPPSSSPNLGFSSYGVLWSYGPAYHATTGTPPQADTPFTATQANGTVVYSTDTAPMSYFSGYPTSAGSGFPTGTPPAPYNQRGNATYWTDPNPSHPGRVNRRVLNLIIADCPAITGTGNCVDIHFLGVGKFFMQVRADGSGSPKKLLVEFAGLVDPIQTTEIKLYR